MVDENGGHGATWSSAKAWQDLPSVRCFRVIAAPMRLTKARPLVTRKTLDRIRIFPKVREHVCTARKRGGRGNCEGIAIQRDHIF